MASGAADDARRQKYLSEVLGDEDSNFASTGEPAGTGSVGRQSMPWAAPRPPVVEVVKRNGRGPGENTLGEVDVAEQNVMSNRLIRNKLQDARNLGSLSHVLVQDYRQEALLSSTLSMGDALTSLLQMQTAKRLTSLGLNPPQPSETHLPASASAGPAAPRELGGAAASPSRASQHLAHSHPSHASDNPHNPAASSSGGGGNAERSSRGNAAEWASGVRGHAAAGAWAGEAGSREGASMLDGLAGGESGGGKI